MKMNNIHIFIFIGVFLAMVGFGSSLQCSECLMAGIGYSAHCLNHKKCEDEYCFKIHYEIPYDSDGIRLYMLERGCTQLPNYCDVYHGTQCSICNTTESCWDMNGNF